MALTKVDYVKNQTIITADNLNEIQDNVIINANEIDTAKARLDTAEMNIESCFGNITNIKSEIQSNTSDIEEIRATLIGIERFTETIDLPASGWTDLIQDVATTNALLLSDTPHITLAVPTAARKEAFSKIGYAIVYLTNTRVPMLRFVCFEEVPTIDLKLQVEVIR